MHYRPPKLTWEKVIKEWKDGTGPYSYTGRDFANMIDCDVPDTSLAKLFSIHRITVKKRRELYEAEKEA